MEHLAIHLAEEALLAGPVQFRWMYLIERYLLTLKEYVRNRAHLKASTANGYLIEECINFCTWYLNDMDSKSKQPSRMHHHGTIISCALRKAEDLIFDSVTWEQAY
ncbi:hypothetical protein ACH5RR_023221 [Cinchona calisaya]|uniref:DUF4218 domain-containing protein n=1 Tax=Cinchona calisaya TaxID=153742 RepID=A0ABD2ZB52_9GENT